MGVEKGSIFGIRLNEHEYGVCCFENPLIRHVIAISVI